MDGSVKDTPSPLPGIMITFESNQASVNLDLKQVAQLFTDIHTYNRRFSAEGIMVSLFMDEEDTPALQTFTETNDNEQTNAFFLTAKHKQTLEAIGLQISPTDIRDVHTEHAHVNASEIAIQIFNKHNFTAFLQALTPEHITQTKLEKPMEDMLGNMFRTATRTYESNEPNVETVELFMGIDEILSEYKRLGLTAYTQEFTELSGHWKTGDIHEFILIQKSNLLSLPESKSGPGNWQRDASPEYLSSRWDEAINLLEKTAQNPQAHALFEQLKDNLTKSIAFALTNLSTLGYVPTEVKKKNQTILETAQQKLQMLLRELEPTE